MFMIENTCFFLMIPVNVTGLFPETHKPRLLQKVGFQCIFVYILGMFPETNFPKLSQKVNVYYLSHAK